ncbi:glucoamylase family protein [Microbacterium sp. 179-I 3D4 NHS]
MGAAATIGLVMASLTLAGPVAADAEERDSADLHRWAQDTWRSLTAMTDERTGLPADHISGDLATLSAYTSPTNIGGYLWSTVTARDLGLIGADEARDRMSATLDTLADLDRHDASGMFYNWYSPTTGQKLTSWPGSGDPVHPFLSSVDNGWLAAALRIVRGAEPLLAARAEALYDSMDFSTFFDPIGVADLPGGSIRGGFWDSAPPDCSVASAMHGHPGHTVYYTCHYYDTTVSESRIAIYLGIADGDIPATALHGTRRTMPPGCGWSWQEQLPQGEYRTYDGAEVWEGVYRYEGMSFVPSWGGSMFEALMPDLLVPETTWGPTSWRLNHPITVAVQKKHGLDDAGYGYWGFSPASNPFGGYGEYGVDVAGIRSDGYASDVERTDADVDKPGCSDGARPSPDFGDGVVTPHASFLALPYDRKAVMSNLRGLEDDLDVYGPGGFYDAVAVGSGTIAEQYLSLDQSMIMAAIGNELTGDLLKDYFVDPDMEKRLRPAMRQQEFGASWGAGGESCAA